MSTPSTLSGIQTAHGEIPFPAYIPVTTFGHKYPLDDLIRPYLRRLAPAAMVSLHYAKQMKTRPNLPLLIDSGGFASLFKNATVKKSNGFGLLELNTDEGTETTDPLTVLDFQEEHADIAFTLDFPIPPSMLAKERKLRQSLTIANAFWALENRRRRDMPLYACVQGWDVKSFQDCAREMATGKFDGLAIGGLVPRSRDKKLILAVVDAVREESPDLPIHIFGLGKPELVKKLFKRGVQSVDSSSFVKLAAKGRSWNNPKNEIITPSPVERLQLAISNLATANEKCLPLNFKTRIAA